MAATALLSAGLAGQAAAQAIKIGVNEPLTGPFAASGTYVVNGAKIAADEINARGGVLGKEIELIVNVQVGLIETMGQSAQDMSAQLSKIKATDSESAVLHRHRS